MKEQGLFHYGELARAGLHATRCRSIFRRVEPSIAGPRRPQDRIRLSDARRSFREALPSLLPSRRRPPGKRGG